MNDQEKRWLNEEESWLNGWYKKCRNKYIDLCNFGGSELFVIEGDSLLFKFLYDPETDFVDFSQHFGGGQYLALAFLVENFLKKFKERECTFHVVFFDVHQSIWNNRPELRLAREIIINHLKSQNTKIPVHEFKNWWNEEWKKYLDDKQPLFILTGDGSTEHLEIKESEKYIEEEKNSSITGIATKNSLSMTIVLRAFMFSTLNTDMPVALMTGMKFRDSRVYAFVFERAGNVDLRTIKKLPDVERFSIKALEVYDEKSIWFKNSVENFNLSTEIKNLLSSQEHLQIWSNGGKKIVLILLSLTGVLCNNNEPDVQYFQHLARIFLLHIILLDYLPLSSRAVPPIDDENTNQEHKKRIELFLQSFYAYCAKIYISDILKMTENFQDLKDNLYDLVDTRLFVSLIQCQYDGVLNFDILPIQIKEQFDACWNILKRFCECNGLNSLNVNVDEKFQIASYEKSYLEYDNEASLCPFKYEAFEEFLGPMRLGLPENPKEIDVGKYGLIGDCDYDDSTYCYLLKQTKDAKKSASYYEKHKTSHERKGYQQYVRFLEKYAASLNGTQGYYRQKIIVERSNRKETSKSTTKSGSKSGSKSVKKESTGAKRIREKIEQEKQNKDLETSERHLDDVLKDILKDGNIRNQLNSLNVKLEKTEKNKIKHPFTMFRGQFKKLEFLMKLWKESCTNSKQKDFSIPVDIMRQVFYIAQNFKTCLDDERKEILIQVLNRLKLTNCKSYLKKIPTVSKEKPPSFKFEFPSDWSDLSVGMSDARFQMLYAGHLMDRNTNSVDDDRVKHFKPDEWQVNVLNVIDNEESALICCPTSSGKTFISFYAMEKVLRESDDGILVYVSPTKALVNQVTAEVYGRFEKSYDYGDKTTWGIYTREYSENHDKCQILVTVPQMLESLIFSPQRASWARNIKRIIFDEVHVIGSDGGEYYDRLLLLSKSVPILALSATIGNPETFNDWIDKPKSARGHRMRLIKTTKRFSDLQPYVYLPEFPLPKLLETTVNPKEKQRQNSSIIPINPVFSLSMSILKEHGFPDDMKLVPSQCVQLWDIMKKNSGNNPPKGLDKLDPDVYFKNIGYIVKDNADDYEQKLKEIFTECAKDDNFDGLIESTIKELGADIKNGFEKLESTATETANELDVYGDKFLEEGIVPLLCELSAQDKLPAILFHFDEKGCVELVRHILEQLESAEEEKRANDPEYQAKKKSAISQQEAFDKAIKRKRDKKSTAPQEDDPQEPDEPAQNFFDWEAHDSDFTFVDKRSRVTTEEFEEIVGPARHKMNNSKLLVAALERGIGVHHTDLPRKYLSAVEILFRRRHLRVIIATGTLALGINMPCKTTVFVGDSISLTALQYRQMSGRSGRRGFDPLGHVVFFGITLTKIIRLLMSGLPNLSRHFPLTTTLALRSFNLLNQCKNKKDDHDYAKDAIKGLFEPFIFLGKEYGSTRIKYHLRFSIEYLMRENLLNQKGNLINLSAMASHLNYSDPSNFAFAVLYKHGVFHRICSASRTSEDIMNDLILILSHLFNRIKLRKISKDWYKNEEYTSKIILPPLPKDINNILEQHEKRVLEIYTDYVVTFAKNISIRGQIDNTLPLSSITIPSKSMDKTLLQEDPLISKLTSMAISFIARSPFIAMCGSLGDIFNNLEDLTSHVRREIYLDLHSIPFIKTDEVLNAYVSDFFSNGHEKALVEANGIRRGEVWQVLNDFNWVLSAIIISLRNGNFGSRDILEEDELVLKGFEMVMQHFYEKFVRTWV